MMKTWGAMEIHRINHKIVSFNIRIDCSRHDEQIISHLLVVMYTVYYYNRIMFEAV